MKARIFRKIADGIVECPGCKRHFGVVRRHIVRVRTAVGTDVPSMKCPNCSATEYDPAPEADQPVAGEFHLETVSGQKVNPFDVRPEDVDIADVAFALSNICRWHGHIDRSVLEHSLDTMEFVRTQGASVETQLAALTHDAQEYVLNDLARGVKRQPEMTAYREAEARAVETLRELWGIEASDEHAAAAKHADTLLLFLEADRWLPSRGREFVGWCDEVAADVERYNRLFPVTRVAWKAELRRLFLHAFANLRRDRVGGGTIVGVSGYKRSGKGTFARVLCREGGFVEGGFTDALKQECSEYAGISLADLERDKAAWRPLLQSRGSFVRRRDSGFWIRKLRERFDEYFDESRDSVYAPSFVISDLRHPNEAEFVREYAESCGMKSTVVRLRRADQPDVTEDSHESEQMVDEVDADLVVTGGCVDDVERAARDFLNGKWDVREK